MPRFSIDSKDKRKKSNEKRQTHEPPLHSEESSESAHQVTEKNRREDDDRRCYSLRASPSQMGQCSNEQFLTSCLPLLGSLGPKKNFLARINIQKAIYDVLDEDVSEYDESAEQLRNKSSSRPASGKRMTNCSNAPQGKKHSAGSAN
ncbi:unnamed protein product, partial [Nesidiocoris tenuis]